jgi:hypothetical protein
VIRAVPVATMISAPDHHRDERGDARDQPGADAADPVLLRIAQDAGTRLRDIAAALSITERGAYGIVTDLTTAGYIVRQKDSRSCIRRLGRAGRRPRGAGGLAKAGRDDRMRAMNVTMSSTERVVRAPGKDGAGSGPAGLAD